MPPSERVVRRLRLRGPSDGAIRRAALAFEDALRTASLPDHGGRVLLLRRLDVGRLEAGGPPVAVADTLQRAITSPALAWRHGGSPDAGAADAVWFRDATEALIGLTARLTGPNPPREWYWRHVIPRSIRGGGTVRPSDVVDALVALEEAEVAIPAWAAALARRGRLDDLTRLLTVDDTARLARGAAVGETRDRDAAPQSTAGEHSLTECGSPQPGTARADARPGSRPDTLRFDVGEVLRALARRGGFDPSIGRPRAATQPRLAPPPPTSAPAPVEAFRAAGTGPSDRSHAALGPPSAAEPLRPRFDAVGRDHDGEDTSVSGRFTVHDPDLPGDNGAGAAASHRSLTGLPRGTDEAETSDAADSPVVATRAGGLLFLLNALERVGFGAWMRDHPAWHDQEIARRMASNVLTRLDVAVTDVAWSLARPIRDAPHPPPPFDPPANWPAQPSSFRADEAARAWCEHMERWLDGEVGLDLPTLVLRPAEVTASVTHVDVGFEAAMVDLRIRRHGLDVDPGWVPWYGRVVSFRYGSGAGR